MHWVLGYNGQDGPTARMLQQTQLKNYFPTASVANDMATLRAVLAGHPRPVSVMLISPQDGNELGDYQSADRIFELAQDVCQRADAVVLAINEVDLLLHRWQDITKISNLWIMAPAQHNFGIEHKPFVIWQHWIQDLRDVWKIGTTRHRLDQIGSVDNRPFLFDVLLGGSRSYRTQLHNLIEFDVALRDCVIMSYYGMPTTRPGFILEPEILTMTYPQPMHTGVLINYNGVEMRLACVPPVSIYQQTYFTVLTETLAHGHMNFYTEKIAKPLMAGRMFLVLGGQYYLRNLRDSGFQTFDPIIDESYDLEPDDQIRVNMVFQEMQRLSQHNPNDLLHAAASRIQHNYDVAWNQDFLGTALAQAQQSILQQRKC